MWTHEKPEQSQAHVNTPVSRSQFHCFLQRPPQDKLYIRAAVQQPVRGAQISSDRWFVVKRNLLKNLKTKITNCSFNVSPVLNVTSVFIGLNFHVKTCRRSEVFLCSETGALVNNILKTPCVILQCSYLMLREHPSIV